MRWEEEWVRGFGSLETPWRDGHKTLELVRETREKLMVDE